MRRLKKKQKEAVLAWIAEGLETGEINERAAKFKPSFDVSYQQVDYFRSTRKADLEAIKASGEFEALTQGFALKENRVKALQTIANMMYRDITNGFLWLDQVKALGNGDSMEVVDYEEFNTAEVKEFRAALDDIAKELGHRKTLIEFNWRDEAKKQGYDPDQLFRDMVNAARSRMVEASGGGSVAGSGDTSQARDE
jgi:hypothetical protein